MEANFQMETGVHKDLESGKSKIVQRDPKRPKLGDPLDAANKETGSSNHRSNHATHGNSDDNNPNSFVNNKLVIDPPPDFSSISSPVKSGDHNPFCSVKDDVSLVPPRKLGGFGCVKLGVTSIPTTVDSKSDKNVIVNGYPKKTGNNDHNPFCLVKEDVSHVPPRKHGCFGSVKHGDTSFQTTVDSKSDISGIDNSYPEKTGDYAHLPPSEAKAIPSLVGRSRDPRVAPTKEDMESDDTIMELYKIWCHLNRITRTPQEMKQRFSFFKENAVGVYEDNIEVDQMCKFGLYHWADDPTLMPRGGLICDPPHLKS